ncbi:MAG TPA: capsule assembly Wzi family protein [Candidatus Kryptobacter bacterium]|nr:capsule assembly Wzi family protein [Candidatus Kryptobacter bacterium]
MRIGIFVLLTISLFGSMAYAQDDFSIPADNWTYGVIQQLQNRGYLLDLSPGFKPYRRIDVAKALENLESQSDLSKIPPADGWLIRKLEDEFAPDLQILTTKRSNADTSFVGARFSEEAFANVAKGDYQTFKYAGKVEFRPLVRTGFGFNIGNHLTLYTDATVNQTLKDDTLYTGSTKFGLDALHRQAYIRYSGPHFDFTFGRDYLSWGYGNNGTVLISTTPGAFDMASLLINTKVMKFNWFVAQLNQMPEFTPDTNNYGVYGPGPTAGRPDPMAIRYFTGSRWEFNIADKVFLGAYQAATFGGLNAPIDLELINPLRLTYETEVNSNGLERPNAFLGLDFSIFYPRDFDFYGDLMIDDWQVDHKTIGDLKPSLYAFDLGFHAANIFSSLGLSGTDVNLQYMMVRNRVYNHYNWTSFMKLLLNNYPIANPYGDDFWSLDLRLSHWLSYGWKLGLEAMHIEHGSQNLYGPYTMPWLTDPNITVATGYNEPFPYGTVQSTNLIQATAMYQPEHYLYGQATLIYSRNHNYDYSLGLNKALFSFLFTIYYNFSTSIPFK